MTEWVEIGAARLACGNCFEILPELMGIDAVVMDPPYGINYTVNARKYGNEGLTALKPWAMEQRAPIAGDDVPFDIEPFLGFGKIALFGGNHMADLPTGGKWIVWDKRRDSKPDSHSDCEFIWTNVPGADRIHRQKWRGIVREGEENCSRSRKLHTNQKPVALLSFIFDQIGVSSHSRVLDPFMGSGSTGVVCVRRGLPFVGIEIEQQHFDVACARIEREFIGAAA